MKKWIALLIVTSYIAGRQSDKALGRSIERAFERIGPLTF